jgi:hypothetical protein
MRVGERTGKVENKEVKYFVIAKCRMCKQTIKVPMGECYSVDQTVSIFNSANVQLVTENITHKCVGSKHTDKEVVGICTAVGFVCEKVEKVNISRQEG